MITPKPKKRKTIKAIFEISSLMFNTVPRCKSCGKLCESNLVCVHETCPSNLN